MTTLPPARGRQSVHFAVSGHKELQTIAKKLSKVNFRKALLAAGEFFQSSHKAGFLDQRSPDGEKWASTPDWWREMKNNSTPLTGVTAGGGQFHTIKSGKWRGFRIRRNAKQMKGVSLQHRLKKDSIELFYPKDVEERARINQFGEESKMHVYLPGKSNRYLVFDVKVKERPHLGLATTWRRLGVRTDPEHVVHIFNQQIISQAFEDI